MNDEQLHSMLISIGSTLLKGSDKRLPLTDSFCIAVADEFVQSMVDRFAALREYERNHTICMAYGLVVLNCFFD